MRSTLAAALLLAASCVAAAQTSATWNYQGKDGALVWGKLDPAYKACADGHEQSPIDIRGARLNKALQPLDFHYHASSVTLENNGRTIVAHVAPGSYLNFDGVRYDLIEYDFHHPSETAVRGKLSDMEIHLYHKNSDGKMLVLAIRLAESPAKPNGVLATLWQNLPFKAGSSVKVEEYTNPAGLLPADRGYWSYAGSLSTPPCTEGVRWVVLEEELALSRDQLRTFAAIFKINTRQIQDTHGRRIEANE